MPQRGTKHVNNLFSDLPLFRYNTYSSSVDNSPEDVEFVVKKVSYNADCLTRETSLKFGALEEETQRGRQVH